MLTLFAGDNAAIRMCSTSDSQRRRLAWLCVADFVRPTPVARVNNQHLIPVVLDVYRLGRTAHHVIDKNEPPFGVFLAIIGDLR